MARAKLKKLPPKNAKLPVKTMKAERRLRKDEALALFKKLARSNSKPTTELYYTNPYTLLVAVALSAQMTDAGVNKATKGLFKKVDSPQKMLTFGLEKLQAAISGVNFHRTKARNVLAMARQLIDKHGGKVPEDRAALESLPGVGRKTANVILNTIFRQPVLAVDTHVFRVANRTGLAYGATPLEVEQGLYEIVPESHLVDAHHWLILHGRYICVARKPHCPRCVIRDICLYPDKTPPEEDKEKV